MMDNKRVNSVIARSPKGDEAIFHKIDAVPECFNRGLLRFARNDTGRGGRNDTVAQSTLEFTFAVIVIMFLVYGMVQIFRWAGMDLANRRWVQDNSITMDLSNVSGGDPSAQLNSDVSSSFLPVSAVWHGSITNGNTAQ